LLTVYKLSDQRQPISCGALLFSPVITIEIVLFAAVDAAGKDLNAFEASCAGDQRKSSNG